MNRKEVLTLMRAVQRGAVTPALAADRLASLGTGDLGFARVDHHRALRRGVAEAIFGQGKTAEQIISIVAHLARRGDGAFVTRVDPAVGNELVKRHPVGRHDALSRTFLLAPRGRRPRALPGLVIVSAGTADLPVAEEAAVAAESLGLAPDRIYDVGVAGLHRLLEQEARLREARVVIVVAGMEGALASVVAGLVAAPVIGVPTSVGYGTALSGFTALFAMLTSCAGGVTVVNIDNGYGAACAAAAILRSGGRKR